MFYKDTKKPSSLNRKKVDICLCVTMKLSFFISDPSWPHGTRIKEDFADKLTLPQPLMYVKNFINATLSCCMMLNTTTAINSHVAMRENNAGVRIKIQLSR